MTALSLFVSVLQLVVARGPHALRLLFELELNDSPTRRLSRIWVLLLHHRLGADIDKCGVVLTEVPVRILPFFVLGHYLLHDIDIVFGLVDPGFDR